MEEIWKDIKGYEGLYQISNLGNVKSVKRNINQEHFKNNKYSRKINEKLVKQANNGKHYKTVSLCVNGKKHTKSVHKLVAEAFIPNPNNFPVINHIDGNKKNNKVENLEWCTYKYNTLEAIRLGNFYFIKRGKRNI